MIYLYFDIDAFKDTDYDNLLNLASQERAEYLSRYRFMKDKKIGLLAYLLLRLGLKEEFGYNKKPVFYYGVNNKPYLKNPEHVLFNLSHCALGVGCGISTNEIGIDIQDIVPYNEDEASIILSEREKHLQASCDNKDLTFTILWALKESYLKYSGQGITEDLTAYDFSSFDLKPFWLFGKRFSISLYKNCVVSVCSDKEEEIRIVSKSELYTL